MFIFFLLPDFCMCLESFRAHGNAFSPSAFLMVHLLSSFPYHFNLPLLWSLNHFDAERTKGNGYTGPFLERLDPNNLAEAADAALRSQVGVFQIHRKVDGFSGRE
jgi:hypothetical protein